MWDPRISCLVALGAIALVMGIGIGWFITGVDPPDSETLEEQQPLLGGNPVEEQEPPLTPPEEEDYVVVEVKDLKED